MTHAAVRTLLAVVTIVGLGACAANPTSEPAEPTTTVRSAGETVGGPAGLPFDLPSPSTLRASEKKVFAHYFTPYPLSLDNASSDSDTYTTAFLDVTGDRGQHAAYGGLLRDRPVPVSPSDDPGWETANYRTEVRQAIAAGIDGFTADLLDLYGQHWGRFTKLLDAAESVDGGFSIVLNPDGASDDIGRSPRRLADALASVAMRPSVLHTADGRLVVSPVAPENQGAAWWHTFVNEMRVRHQITVALVPTFVDRFSDHVAEFASFSYGLSRWGWWTPSTNSTANISELVQNAHRRGRIFMDAVTVQSFRPNAATYWEAGGTANLRAAWTGAIESSADWVQMVTWNDYSENTQFAPSVGNGHVPLDISSYYLTWFKTGSPPPIVRNTVYIAHRLQRVNARPASQRELADLQPGDAARDEIEVVSFLTESGSLSVTVGTKSYSFDVPAGVSSQRVPLTSGAIDAEAVIDGAPVALVRSPRGLDMNPRTQDLTYYFSSSRRQ